MLWRLKAELKGFDGRAAYAREVTDTLCAGTSE